MRPVGETPNLDQLAITTNTNISADRAGKRYTLFSVYDLTCKDASFEVLGAPYSLLKVSLSASQPFYTRQGTLVGLSGKPDNVLL